MLLGLLMLLRAYATRDVMIQRPQCQRRKPGSISWHTAHTAFAWTVAARKLPMDLQPKHDVFLAAAG